MPWLYIAISSHFIFALVFILDKILVKKVFSPLNYVLVIGGLSSLSLFLLPFVDFSNLNGMVLATALLSGVFSIIGIYFYFKILLKYEASWVVPLLFGVFVPIVTFILSRFFLGEILSSVQFAAFTILIIGGFILSFGRKYNFHSILILLIAGIFLSLELVFLKSAFNHVDFISGYILSRFGGFLAGFIIFLIFYRKRLTEFSGGNIRNYISNSYRGIGLVLFKQFLSLVGNLILVFSVSIGNLTLINGLGGIRYSFVFFLAIFFSRKWPAVMEEPLNFWMLVKKSIAIIFIMSGVLILLLEPVETPGAKSWGATFTTLYSRELGLNEKDVLIAALDDLKIKEFRVVAYWSQIEEQKGQYDFSDLDFQIESIASRGGKIILAVGERLPRWPECHIPDWASEQEPVGFIRQVVKQFPHYEKAEEFQGALLGYIEATVNRYKNNSAIWAWQLENEPFLIGFGECPYVDDELIDKEIDLMKRLDSARPLILTDSGEFGMWFRAYKRADIFGTTMYRVVLSRLIPIGHFKYPLDPDFFKIKLGIMEMFWGKKPIVGVELQAEPWLLKRPPLVSLDEQLKAFSFEQFKENIGYAREAGFEKNFLWGLEWWYWMKEKQGHPEFWEEARKLFVQ